MHPASGQELPTGMARARREADAAVRAAHLACQALVRPARGRVLSADVRDPRGRAGLHVELLFVAFAGRRLLMSGGGNMSHARVGLNAPTMR